MLGQFDASAEAYRCVVGIKPGDFEAHYHLGTVLLNLDKLEAAIASFRRVLEIKPDHAKTHYNLGSILHERGRLAEAESSFRQALMIDRDYAEAYHELGLVLLKFARVDEAVASFRKSLEIKPDNIDTQSALLLALNYPYGNSPDSYLVEARQYGRMVSQKVKARWSSWQIDKRPERLRVGMVSGDLRNHPVGHFLQGMLAQLDHDHIELIAYPTVRMEDKFSASVKPHFAAWKPLFGLDDEAAARLIHADGVHVLLDLSGHTAFNRLPVFAWKPAPVQATWLGYFATTGVAEMDYLLADVVGIPEAMQSHFTESIWYLPDTRLCFTPPAFDLSVASLPALQNGFITFGCFQNLAKVGDEVLEVWGRILAALPGAKLRMQARQLGEPAHVSKLLQRLQRYGVDTARVATHAPARREDYLAAHAEVDILLDTFPYPGGTTTCEALWMGVPTLTLAGGSMLARQGASLLTAAGLPEWVAASKEEYVAKAINMAADKAGLAALRAVLREQVLASPLFDAPRFARHFEESMWGMWRAYDQTQLEC